MMVQHGQQAAAPLLLAGITKGAEDDRAAPLPWSNGPSSESDLTIIPSGATVNNSL